MQRLASRILIVVVLFVVAVAGLLVSRSRRAPDEATGPAPSVADLRVKELDLTEQTAGGGHWRLVADQAEVFDAEGRTSLRNVTVHVQDRQGSWTIVGAEGDLFRDTKNIEIRHNVVVTSADGLRLETSVLRWDGGRRRLWTDAPVRIVRPGTEVVGRGLDVRTEEEATTVHGPVSVVFRPGPRS